MQQQSILGNSRAIKDLRTFINVAARCDLSVLLLGETGVGKELAARQIHFSSKRKEAAFLKVNCANLPDSLLESELFGHKKGAYTGALSDKSGLLEEANHGTVFLDEITDADPIIQAKLLGAIEDREIRRLGENRTKLLDIRFISATNADMSGTLSSGKFRSDFYYRISSLSFRILPLRERREDLPLIVENLLRQETEKNYHSFTLTNEAIDKLLNYSFPGNVRELESIIRRAAVLSESGEIAAEHIFLQDMSPDRKHLRRSRFNRLELIRLLKANGGNVTKTAKDIGISRAHIYRLLNTTGKE